MTIEMREKIDAGMGRGFATGAVIFAGLTLAALTACASSTSTGRPAAADETAGTCRPDAIKALVGKGTMPDDEVMRLTGATVVRRIGPDDITTKEFYAARATITIDPATNRIVAASCG